MDEVWCADYCQNLVEQGNFLYLIGPFDTLTPDLVEELIAVTAKAGPVKPYHLHLLIDPRLKCLDLSGCRAAANKDAIIKLIAARCKKLLKLNIASCNQVLPRVLTDLVSAIPHITVLNLKQTKCSDQVLASLSQCCLNLRDLDISYCPVSDLGMASLCIRLGDQPLKCEKLVKLNIMGTAVTSKGAEIAISNLKHLRIFFYSDICESLFRLFGSPQKQLEFGNSDGSPKLLLQYLSVEQMKASLAPVAKSIDISCRMCPFITEVYFIRGVTNQGLKHLQVLEHLKSITLANSDEEVISFEGGVLPLLEIRGQTIKELSLNEINNIDFSCIGAFCPNLKTLSCIISGYGESTFPVFTRPELLKPDVRCFSKLQNITLMLHCPENTIADTSIKLLLENAHDLETINLNSIAILTDELLSNIYQMNKFTKVRSLQLESCNEVTEASVWVWLVDDNELSYLNLSHCLKINYGNMQLFKQYCKSKAVTIDIEWR